MNETIIFHSTEATRFLAQSEEKIIARFMQIAGLGDECQRAIDLSETSEFNRYAQMALIRTFTDRGYEIGEYSDKLPPRTGADIRMMWQLFLLHDGKKVAHSDIEIKIDTMRRTEYGGTL
jgi:hypothetical protein